MATIGKYTIVGQIGLGGFGVVYEGTDPFLKRRVAIKTCTSEASDIRDRFFREAEIAGNLKHRHIVTVHDFGIQDGVPYLVQEYLSGEDLDRKVKRQEPLALTQKVEVLLQIARGLEYAHSRGVIHRDVKPANVRVTDDGTVKIMDFGIAKLANVASHLTRTGMTLGTAAYLPPEQIRGGAVDHRADLFSFGVLAYELLAYARPFNGRTISVLFMEILQREPAPLATHGTGCPPSLEAMVLQCLAKDPEARPGGFGPVIAELLRTLQEVPLATASAPGTSRAAEPGSEASPAVQPVPGQEGGVPRTSPARAGGAPGPTRQELAERTTLKVSADAVRAAKARVEAERRSAQRPPLPEPSGAEAPARGASASPLGWGLPDSPPATAAPGPGPPATAPRAKAAARSSAGPARGRAAPTAEVPWALLGALGAALLLLALAFWIAF